MSGLKPCTTLARLCLAFWGRVSYQLCGAPLARLAGQCPHPALSPRTGWPVYLHSTASFSLECWAAKLGSSRLGTASPLLTEVFPKPLAPSLFGAKRPMSISKPGDFLKVNLNTGVGSPTLVALPSLRPFFTLLYPSLHEFTSLASPRVPGELCAAQEWAVSQASWVSPVKATVHASLCLLDQLPKGLSLCPAHT